MTAVHDRLGHRSIGRVALGVAVVFALAGCGSSMTLRPTTERSHVGTESALDRVAEAEKLVADIAVAVSPGSVVTKGGDDVGPTDCTSPFKGQVWYTISRAFNSPAGTTGSSLLPAIIDQLHNRGFKTDTVNPLGDLSTVNAAGGNVGVGVLAYHESRLIWINVDTQCGAPSEQDLFPSAPTSTSPDASGG